MHAPKLAMALLTDVCHRASSAIGAGEAAQRQHAGQHEEGWELLRGGVPAVQLSPQRDGGRHPGLRRLGPGSTDLQVRTGLKVSAITQAVTGVISNSGLHSQVLAAMRHPSVALLLLPAQFDQQLAVFPSLHAPYGLSRTQQPRQR